MRGNTVSVCTSLWEGPDSYGPAGADLLAGVPSSTGMTTGKFVAPEEVAPLVTYLASPHAASVTGADNVIDGGSIKTV
ncbi:SDR family oxidoreductase [Nonomuraea sp. NPDC000554]|uniref:SDR family oxidoreductase n=1 Tax=Nonomuraea sp. NPDC000554 TaxID=3154259 RepID=UPI0033269444